MTRDCRGRIAKLFAYLDGELTPSRRRTIEAHLASCDCCGELATSIRRAMAVSEAAGRTRVPARIHRRAVTQVRRLLGK